MGISRNHVTRNKLLDEGILLFNAQGYHATGIQEIVDKTGIPKGSFYNYFKSKESFGAEVVRHWCAQTLEYMEGHLNGSQGDAFSTLVKFFQQEIVRHEESRFVGCMCGNLGAELGNTKELVQEAMITAMQGIRQQFARVIERGQKEGTIRSDLSPEELAYFILDAYEGAVLRMKIEGSVRPLEGFCACILDGYVQADGYLQQAVQVGG